MLRRVLGSPGQEETSAPKRHLAKDPAGTQAPDRSSVWSFSGPSPQGGPLGQHVPGPSMLLADLPRRPPRVGFPSSPAPLGVGTALLIYRWEAEAQGCPGLPEARESETGNHGYRPAGKSRPPCVHSSSRALALPRRPGNPVPTQPALSQGDRGSPRRDGHRFHRLACGHLSPFTQLSGPSVSPH